MEIKAITEGERRLERPVESPESKKGSVASHARHSVAFTLATNSHTHCTSSALPLLPPNREPPSLQVTHKHRPISFGIRIAVVHTQWLLGTEHSEKRCAATGNHWLLSTQHPSSPSPSQSSLRCLMFPCTLGSRHPKEQFRCCLMLIIRLTLSPVSINCIFVIYFE